MPIDCIYQPMSGWVVLCRRINLKYSYCKLANLFSLKYSSSSSFHRSKGELEPSAGRLCIILYNNTLPSIYSRSSIDNREYREYSTARRFKCGTPCRLYIIWLGCMVCVCIYIVVLVIQIPSGTYVLYNTMYIGHYTYLWCACII